MTGRSSFQTAVRIAAVAFVLAWLFLDGLQAWIPFWLPFAVLVAAEVEFVLRGRREPRTTGRPTTAPGPEDADLGFGELVEDEHGLRYVPPPPRPEPRRAPRLLWLAGAILVAVLFVVAARSDRRETWQALPQADRARAAARLESEAAIIARRPVTLRCDEGYAFTGAGSDTLGIAFPNAGIAYLDPDVCRSLYDVLTSGDRGEREGEALVVLAHEAVHLRGERDEGVTECLALQEAVTLGMRLGLDERTSESLARREYEKRRAERSVIRAAYALPASCTDGGALDKSPGDGQFP